MKFNANIFVSCHQVTLDKLKERAAQLGLSKYGDLVRWALLWAITAPRDELVKYAAKGGEDD